MLKKGTLTLKNKGPNERLLALSAGFCLCFLSLEQLQSERLGLQGLPRIGSQRRDNTFPICCM